MKVLGGGGAALTVPAVVRASALGKDGAPPPSEQIRLGIIGARGMGRGNLSRCDKHSDVVVTAACDVWKTRRDTVLQKHKDTAKGYSDYRELLASKDVDAVIIATPPHWHCRQCVDAAEAGKDIYQQKPLSLYPSESLAMKRAVEKHKRVAQVGTQMHSCDNYRRILAEVRSGKLGKISVVRTINVLNQEPQGIGKAPPTETPEGLDWDLWVGPSPMLPFNPTLARSSYWHSSWMDFGGGWIPCMAPHIIDMPYWALNLGLPLATTCSGGRYIIDDDGDCPDVQEVLWQYPELTMTHMMSMVNSYAWDAGSGKPARRIGMYFHGVDGTLFGNYGACQITPEGDRMKDAPEVRVAELEEPLNSMTPTQRHVRDWLDCIRTRKEPAAAISYHYQIGMAVALANLSLKLGRSVCVDPKTEKIVGDDAAAKAAVPEYRDPWKFPAEYL